MRDSRLKRCAIRHFRIFSQGDALHISIDFVISCMNKMIKICTFQHLYKFAIIHPVQKILEETKGNFKRMPFRQFTKCLKFDGMVGHKPTIKFGSSNNLVRLEVLGGTLIKTVINRILAQLFSARCGGSRFVD